MYPEPHVPSAPTERPLAGDCKPSKQTLFVLCSSVASVLLVVISLSVSVMRQANLQVERDPRDEIIEEIVVSDRSDHLTEPCFSTRTHPTRLP